MKRIPTIQSVMTPFPYSIPSDAALRRARHMMLEHEVRHLPVVHAGKLVGVISDRDLKRALDPDLGLPPENELFVDDVMVRDPFIAKSTDPLDEVLLGMAEEHIGSVLVVREGKLVGVFTSTDACRAFGEHLRGRGDIGDEVA